MKTEILIKKLFKKELKENLKLFSDIKIPKEYSNLNKELSNKPNFFCPLS